MTWAKSRCPSIPWVEFIVDEVRHVCCLNIFCRWRSITELDRKLRKININKIRTFFSFDACQEPDNSTTKNYENQHKNQNSLFLHSTCLVITRPRFGLISIINLYLYCLHLGWLFMIIIFFLLFCVIFSL